MSTAQALTLRCRLQDKLKAQCKATQKVMTLAGRVRWFRRIGENNGARSHPRPRAQPRHQVPEAPRVHHRSACHAAVLNSP